MKTKIKGIYSPESLQHDKPVQTMHVLSQVKPGNLLKEWNSRSTLKMQAFEIGPKTEPAVARPIVYVPNFSLTLVLICYLHLYYSTNTSTSTASNKLLTSPEEITKAEVYVIHFHEHSFYFR